MRCAIYTRKSSDERLNAEYNSLDNQRAYCSAYIMSQAGDGWEEAPKTYDDGGFSGGNLKRPGLTALRADLAAGKIDIVVVYKIDRLSRSLRDFANLIAEFDQHGVTFVSVTQSFNTASAMGKLTLNILLSFAQFERELTGERLKDWFAGARARGMWVHGKPPYGYRAVDLRLEIDESEAACVRYAFAHYSQYGSAKILASVLHQRGWLNNYQRPWRKRTLTDMLQNPVYIGKLRHHGKLLPGTHEPIVTMSAWRKVQDAIAASARRRKPLSRPPVLGLLKGLIVDANGAPMIHVPVHHRNGKIYRYYIPSDKRYGVGACSMHRFQAGPLENCVLSLLERLTGRPQVYPDMYVACGQIRKIVRQVRVWPDRMSVTMVTGAMLEAEHAGRMQITHKPRTPPEWLPRAVELMEQGATPHKTARDMGISIGSFYRILHRWGMAQYVK